MKRLLNFLTIVSLFLLMGCAKDNIVLIDPLTTDDTDDDITNTTFALTVQVTFSESGASVTGTTDDFTTSISGNDVTIVYTGEEYVMYELSGTTTDGFFKLYSPRKQGITLNSVAVTNPNGAAINVQGPQATPNKGKRTFIVLNGTNSLADGASYTDTPSTEDEKGAMFGEGQFIFSGDGILNVVAQGKSGIVSDDYLHFMQSGTVAVSSSAGNGIRGKDCILVTSGTISVSVSADMKKGLSSDGYVTFDGGSTTITVSGGTAYDSEDGEYTGSAGVKADGYFKMNGGGLTITNTGTGGKGISCDGNGYFSGGQVEVYAKGSNYGSGGGGGFPGGGGNSNTSSVSAKGIKCDGNLVFSGGKVTVNSYAHEAIEAKGSITITDGEVVAISQADDAINAGSDFTISDGYVFGFSSGNDGLDANGNFYIKGGVVYAIGTSSPEVAIDANSEGGYKLYLTGGTLIAIGGLESGSSLSQSCYSASSWSQNTWYGLTVGSKTYAFMTQSSGGTPLVVSGSSTPTLKSGVTYSGGTSHFESWLFEDATISGGTSVSLSSYTGGNGGGVGPGGGGNGPGGH